MLAEKNGHAMFVYILRFLLGKMNIRLLSEQFKLGASKHRYAIFTALFIGLLCIAPQIFFIAHLGAAYRGIPYMQTANEEDYLGFMKDVEGGHLLSASSQFFEYKNSYPTIPPIFAIPYVVVSKLFHISLASTLTVGKFFLPAILFFLVYLLIYRLSGEPDDVRGKINAIAGGLLVVLGFDLQDYRTVWNFLRGQGALGYAIIWTRPMNPISGAVLIFTFLLCLWSLISQRRLYVIVLAAIALALMMSSYFFSWSASLAVMGVVGLLAFLRAKKELIKSMLGVLGLALLFSSPYWFMVWKASQLPWAAEAAARTGLLSSHAPHFNKFIIAALTVFLAISYLVFYIKKNIKSVKEIQEWWWFCAAMLLGGLLAYNQQVITGKEIWYYHYVFYTIPFGYITLVVLLWNFIKPMYPRAWLALASMVVAVTVFSGISVQISSGALFPYYANLQKYAGAFNFLEKTAPKDCVVLADEDADALNNLINDFTHCDSYFSTQRFLVAPIDRFYHNYMTLLRFRGVKAEEIDDYLKRNLSEAQGALYYQLQYSLGYIDEKLENDLKKFPGDYREFLKKDFYTELTKYKIDYIFLVGPIRKEFEKSLPIKKVFEENNVLIYSF